MRFVDLPVESRAKFQGKVTSASGAEYVLGQPLGEGAAGVVYQGAAEDGSAVVIKFLCPLQRIAVNQRGLDRIVSRFRAESERGRSLMHQNIVEILDFGGTGKSFSGLDIPFYVMESHVRGSLSGLISNDSPPPKSIRHLWVAQLSAAVEYLHSHGRLHRDIKPHNCLISQAGQLVLGDLGVVYWGDSGASVSTYPHEILTTWEYLAPSAEIDPESYNESADAWSLGKTSIEILAWSHISRMSLILNGIPDQYNETVAGPAAALVRLDIAKPALGDVYLHHKYLACMYRAVEGISRRDQQFIVNQMGINLERHYGSDAPAYPTYIDPGMFWLCKECGANMAVLLDPVSWRVSEVRLRCYNADCGCEFTMMSDRVEEELTIDREASDWLVKIWEDLVTHSGCNNSAWPREGVL